MSIAVIGDLCPDIVVTGVPSRGRELSFGQAEELVASTTATLGGSGALTARAASAMGGPVALIAVVGEDVFGRLSLDLVRDGRVDVSTVRIAPDAPTGSSVILVRQDDPTDREILTHLGALACLEPDEVVAGLTRCDPRFVHVSSFFLHGRLQPSLAGILAQQRERDVVTSLDTNDDPARHWASAREVLSHTDLLFCNDQEALGLAGGGDDPRAAALALLRELPDHPTDARLPAVVHKRGADGVRVLTRDGTLSVAAPELAVVDTVGAGDTLAGTVLAALHEGQGWPAAAARGVAAGSLSTTVPGGLSSRVDLETVTNLAAQLAVHVNPHHQENPP